MSTVNDELRDAATRHRVYTIKHETYLYNRMLIDFLNEMDTNLSDGIYVRLSKLATRGEDTFQLKKYKNLQKWVRESIREQSSVMKEDFEPSLKELANQEAEWQARLLQQEVGFAGLDIDTPSPTALNTIVTQQPLSGKFLNQWISEWGTSKISRVNQSIRLGLAQGETAQTIARTITGTRRNNYRDGILNISRRGANMLVRTTSNDVMTKARDKVYRQNENVIKGIQWVSTLDSKTTPICMARDGQVYPIDSGPRPPAHPNCRSTTVPVTKSFREMGIPLDEFDESVRPEVKNGLAGNVPATETYQTWLEKQSATFQDDVLGPTRGKLFRKGDLPLDRFVEEPSGRQYTLDELKRREPEVWGEVFG